MKREIIDKYITEARLSAYGNMDEYRDNLLLSRRFYILLAILEVALRNSINEHFAKKIGSDWLDDNHFLCKDAKRKISEAKNKLNHRHEPLTNDKIIAELNFGFWVGLFTQPYEIYLRYEDLKKIFPSIPSKKTTLITRRILLSKLHLIKTFRNRLFHYEKVINKPEYTNMEDKIFELLGFFDNELAEFAKELNSDIWY